MKICPACGTGAPEGAVVCPSDGTPLVPGATAATMPVRRSSKPWCATCGAREGDDGGGDCPRCGSRVSAVPSTVPGAKGSRLAGFTVVRGHGEGDMLVTDAGSVVRLLVFGPRDVIAQEAAALAVAGARLPRLLKEGDAVEIGRYALLEIDVDGAMPLLDADLSLAEGLALCRSVLDVAAEIEARGYSWEPSPTDLYLRGGHVLVLRARGARKLAEGERLNAKKPLEALAGALLPEPFGLTTPDVVRLLVPRFNFSTVAARTIDGARDDLDRAESTARGSSGGRTAELCDPGLRRPHSEDATAVADGEVLGEPFAVLVVCDGVSSSSRAGEASSLASRVARDSLAEFARSHETLDRDPTTAVTAAIRAAHEAVCASNVDHHSGAPPGTTIVAAVVRRRTLTVGWLGDSRAYWVSGDSAELCTTDHSWLNEALARGPLSPDEAMESPFAHALTKCLGPLEASLGSGTVNPEVRTRALVGPGHLMLCTDGLWNYFPGADAIGELVRAAGQGGAPEAVARFLVCRALAEGGGDNVSVVVHKLD